MKQNWLNGVTKVVSMADWGSRGVCQNLELASRVEKNLFSCELRKDLIYSWVRVAFSAHTSVEVDQVYTDADLPVALWDHDHSCTSVCGLLHPGNDTHLFHP